MARAVTAAFALVVMFALVSAGKLRRRARDWSQLRHVGAAGWACTGPVPMRTHTAPHCAWGGTRWLFDRRVAPVRASAVPGAQALTRARVVRCVCCVAVRPRQRCARPRGQWPHVCATPFAVVVRSSSVGGATADTGCHLCFSACATCACAPHQLQCPRCLAHDVQPLRTFPRSARPPSQTSSSVSWWPPSWAQCRHGARAALCVHDDCGLLAHARWATAGRRPRRCSCPGAGAV